MTSFSASLLAKFAGPLTLDRSIGADVFTPIGLGSIRIRYLLFGVLLRVIQPGRSPGRFPARRSLRKQALAAALLLPVPASAPLAGFRTPSRASLFPGTTSLQFRSGQCF